MSVIPATGISEGGNIAFAVLYGVVCFAHTFLGLYFRRFKVMILMFIGTALSIIGYAGRARYAVEPGYTPYVMQAVCIAIAPGFVFGAIKELFIHYITFLRLEKANDSGDWYNDNSLKGFRYYELFNVVVNIVSAALIGSGIGTFYNATTANAMKNSVHAVLSGFIIQLVLVMVSIFVWFYFRLYSSNFIQLTTRMKLYLNAMFVAFIFIGIRIAFRVAEWAKIYDVGVVNNLTTDENYLLVLDGMTTLLASVIMLAFHPGFVFGKSELVRIDREFEQYNSEDPEKDRTSKVLTFLAYVPIIRFFVRK